MKTTLLSLLAVSAVCSASAVESTPATPADRPQLVVLDSVMPIIPMRLRDVGIYDGEVRVAISVDSTGKIVDHMIVAYTDPDLADLCVRTLRDWKFAPPVFHGEPIAVQREMTFDFDSKGSVLNLDLTSYTAMNNSRILGRRLIRPSTLKELDRIPTPLHTEHPIAPKGANGDAVIEFFIDATGAVRMPSVVSADTPDLGDAAAATVRSWSFEPPTRQGRPVLVRVQQTFHFKP